MEHKPRVSLVMSIYNDERTVQQTIDSVLSQTYTDFELCIIDDGCTDGSVDIVRSYSNKDARVVLVPFSIHRGLTGSLNEVIRHTGGEYIGRIDADDICLPNRIEEQVKYLDAYKDIMLCGTWGQYIDEDGMYIGDKKLETDSTKIKNKLLWNNQFIHSSWLFRSSLINDVGVYDESFAKSQDYEFVLRVAKKHKVANIPQFLVKWRVRKNSLSWGNRKQELYALKARWVAINQYGYPVLFGLFCIIIRCLYFIVPLSIKRRRYVN